MARTTYANRLQALIDSPAISARDKQFASSLLAYYTRKKSLTAGRARCVHELEERYSAEAIAEREARQSPVLTRLRALTPRLTEGSWAQGFVESLTEQAQAGRTLSPRQLEILTKIEDEHSDEVMASAAAFRANFDAEQRGRLTVCARYYRREGYFTNLVERVLTQDGQPTGYIPTEKEYRKITENKYATKVLAAYYDAPKYPAGSMVELRTSATTTKHRKVNGKPCVVIATNEPIVSAAKGAKRYRILPIGSAEMIIIEERDIKKARGV